MENLENKAKGYALKNAIAHDGKANQGAVMAGLFAEGLEKSEVKDVIPTIIKVLSEVNALSEEEQTKEFDNLSDTISEREVREGLPELPNAENGVVMRTAPSPSGPLHLMHAINLSLNYLYVEKYDGKLYVRIEDTNSDNVYPPAYDMITNEAKWLTDGKAEIIIQSDRMELYYDYAKKLLDEDAAYICTCSGDSFRELARDKKECPCRGKTMEENASDWKKMFDKENGFKEGEAVLRFKTPAEFDGMSNKNPAMRDFPLARVNDSVHPRQGDKYRVWPLMNLSVTADDIELGMTHIIRGKDHRDNAERQKMMYNVLGKEYPWAAFTGMTNFVGMKFSTSQMRKDIDAGLYSGWDAAGLSTVASLKKRGYKPIAFRGYAELTANLSEVDKTMKKEDLFELLDKFNATKTE